MGGGVFAIPASKFREQLHNDRPCLIGYGSESLEVFHVVHHRVGIEHRVFGLEVFDIFRGLGFRKRICDLLPTQETKDIVILGGHENVDKVKVWLWGRKYQPPLRG